MFQRSSPVVLNLVIINVIAYFAQMAFGGSTPLNQVNDLFALHHYRSEVFRPYQLVTHMFMHGSLLHLLFNMLALWMFGSMVEGVWGPKRFLIFYMVCGLAAGLAQMGTYIHDFWDFDHQLVRFDPEEYQTYMRLGCTVGASGAIMGVLAAYGYLFPNTQLFIMPIPFPVKAKWAVAGFIAVDVFSGIAGKPGDNVAHFAHVGGALMGLLIVFIWNRNNKRTFY